VILKDPKTTSWDLSNSSEGEPYPLSSEGEHRFDDKDDPKFPLREATVINELDLDSDRCPLLQTISNSEYKSDYETFEIEVNLDPSEANRPE
jgi:hypothetical protein